MEIVYLLSGLVLIARLIVEFIKIFKNDFQISLVSNINLINPKYLVCFRVHGDIKFIHKINQNHLRKILKYNILNYTQQYKIPHIYCIEIV